MILSQLFIKGFRNFKEATINFNQHSLIIGANDVGKTNLIYAIRLLLDRGISEYDYELDFSDFYAFEPTDEIIIRLCLIDVVEDCIQAKMPGQISDDKKLVIQYKAHKVDSHVEYQFYTGRSVEDLTECDGPFYKKYLNIKYISSRRDFWGYINRIKTKLLIESKEGREAEDIASDEVLYGNIVQMLKDVDEKIPNLSYIKNATTQINTELDKLSIHHNEQKLVFDTSSTEIDNVINKVSLISQIGDKKTTVGGDGRLNQIYLSLWALENQQNQLSSEVSIVCIEEPEAYLHPHQQRKLASYLNGIFQGQIILTSHSPQIACEFSPNSIIRLFKDGHRSIAASDGCSDIIKQGFEDFGYRMSIIPAEAFFSDFVILVEGQSELVFYKTLSKQLNIDLDRYNISVLSVEGVGFETYISILKALGISWSLRTDNDIVKIPNKEAYRYAGIERVVAIMKKYCNLSAEERTIIDENSKLIHGFDDKDNISEPVKNAATALCNLASSHAIYLAIKDLETDLLNSEIKESLISFYGEGLSEEALLEKMKEHKAVNMYKYLKGKKEDLIRLKDNELLAPVKFALESIAQLYETD